MTPEQQARAQEITLVALGLEAAEREAYLEHRTAGEPEVLAEVRRRLEQAGRIPDGFLEGSAGRELAGEGAGGAEWPTELGASQFPEGRRYRLVELLGTGGGGHVYRAHDRRLDRQVAVKQLRRRLAPQPGTQERFEREAKIGARVSHPAIVEVFDVIRDGDDLWIVMELVAGRSLSRRLADGPLDQAEALRIAGDIAAGLAAAHEVGILHGDLKPANVIVSPAGRAKIIDFGVAKLDSPSEEALAGGALQGTPAAMSPEQVACCRLDARSDLFSFGSLLYQMVTGAAPFDAPSPLVAVDRVRHLKPPPAKQLNPAVSEELSVLIETLLEKDPKRRPRDASKVCRTLGRLADRAVGADGFRQHYGRQGEEPAGAFPSAGAERRRITLLSGQLLAPGGTAALLDPEELMAIEQPFRELAMTVIERWDGHLESWLDGGLRACFGVPRAREDDPHRAVAAALELAAAVASWNAGADGLRLRVGVHTGPVVVASRRDGQWETAVGRTGCCAMHLRTAEVRLPPEPSAVLVSSAVRELVGARFDCEPLGPCSVGMCAAPLEAFVVRQGRGGSAAQPAAAKPTAFAGRRAELALLRRRWRDAAGGSGQAVLVNGEAGSGKTRLLQELRELAAAGGADWLDVACRPAALALRLAELLGTEKAGGSEALDELSRRLAERAANGPTVLAIEDVQRSGPEDLDLLGLLIEQAPPSPLLIVLTCRPPFEPPWKPLPHLTACALGPLSGSQARRMIRHLGANELDAATEGEILAAADGVPRFVEELTRMFLRLRQNRAHGESPPASLAPPVDGEPAGAVPPVPVPAPLASWLTTRLDRLGEARELTRAASVLGREFTVAQLSALLPGAEDAIERDLDRLVEDEVLQRRGGRRDARYRFRYALDRSAAWESLLRVQRQLLEWRAAQASAGA